ncbi:CAAX prenyl protease 2 isoform X2 [Ananas comosus]|uniref:intramembrane prenyl-peptidase Rce1 n=1 Tax=Ananas comosus TaxID=4615 RepID=A0A6P5GPL7_ANACO|nr:CAAX prenyl protease 2 isoform X2 [Ananas comosus]
MATENPRLGDPSAAALDGAGVSGAAAVCACAAMAFFYVAILYSPTLILRLPPPTSVESFFLRRFGCAAISSAASVAASAALLGVWRSGDLSLILGVFGIRRHQLWEAVVIPLFLTSLVYAGTLVSKLWLLMNSQIEDCTEDFCCQPTSFMQIGIWAQHFVDRMSAYIHDVLAWRTYVVAPLTEELVFRACMIPLLLCGGFKTYHIIFLSPVFFSLAHLNHFLELYCQRGYSFLKALLIVGVQLGYTVIFGWYAAFLFIRTGNLLSPIVAHIFCNVMGLPVLSSSRTLGLATAAFAVGLACFLWLLFPATNPKIYNNKIDSCSCWHGYCSWS